MARQARAGLLAAALGGALALLGGPASAQSGGEHGRLDLAGLTVVRAEEGVLLSFAMQLELPRGVEEALLKGIPLFFVAEAELYRYRWYWRDKPVGRLDRTWRVSYQPLTRDWRVGFGGLQQRYATLEEALSAISRGTRWKLAEPLPRSDDGDYYVEFSYRLDTSQLSRPLQVGLSGQSEWNLSVQRTVPVPEPAATR